jgi:hypothetical protein
LAVNQRNVITAARDVQAAVIKQRLEPYTDVDQSNIDVGSYVLLEYPERPPDGLAPVLRGPFVVSDVKGDHTYEVTSCADDGVTLVRHVSLLVPFRLRPGADPAAIAGADAREHVVDCIVDHNCGSKRKRDWDFRVRWRGFPDPAEDTWLPWSNVKKLAALDAYARAHPELGL